MRLLARFVRRLCVNKRTITSSAVLRKNEDQDREIDDILEADSEYHSVAEGFFRLGDSHNCLVIQPYVKWGPQKLEIKPQEQIEEAQALIKTLPSWKVQDCIPVPLDTLARKTVFKSGSMDKLTKIIRGNSEISAVFVNVASLKRVQTSLLAEQFGKPIFDRYQIVMQILKLHAISKHAKLQVALAELHYVRRRALRSALFPTTNLDDLKMMLQTREQKIKDAIKNLREQRTLLRNKRKKMEFPTVAVVGYTNAGKTSLIKALTGDKTLMPKNQLFATLDVTMHAGILPSGLQILYVDTVGFISEIPTNLIECFVATLEDAVLADMILHVEDLASSNFEYKRKHVLKTLSNISSETGTGNIMEKMLSVGNKLDLVKEVEHEGLHCVSSTTCEGLEELREKIEEVILKVTERQDITIRVPNGGDEIRWLYKNSTVISEIPDEDSQLINAHVIITLANLEKFKHNFIMRKK